MISQNPRPAHQRRTAQGFASISRPRRTRQKANPALTEDEKDLRDIKAAMRRNDFVDLADLKRELGL